jgi:hypothetical protein
MVIVERASMSRAMARAVIVWWPVIMTTRMPAVLNCFTAARPSGAESISRGRPGRSRPPPLPECVTRPGR